MLSTHDLFGTGPQGVAGPTLRHEFQCGRGHSTGLLNILLLVSRIQPVPMAIGDMSLSHIVQVGLPNERMVRLYSSHMDSLRLVRSHNFATQPNRLG